MKYPILYKRDSKKKIRVWSVEQEGANYRVVSGLQDGKLVTSEWTVAEPKNLGKINETSAEDQATKEIESLYETQLNQGRYFENLAEIDNETYFKPMLADKYNDRRDLIENEFNNNRAVYADYKFDGFRSVITQKGMFTREGKEYLSCPHISYFLISFFNKHPNIVLDGELYNHDYHNNFNKIQSLLTKKKSTAADLLEAKEKVKYYIYDCFDKEQPELPFSERIKWIGKLYEEFILDSEGQNSFVIVEHVPCTSFDDLDNHNAKALENNYEGQIIRINVPYENKRTKFLLKRKEFFDGEYLIKALNFGTGNWAKYIKTADFETADGQTFSATFKGSQEEQLEMAEHMDEYIGRLATVRYPGFLPSGKPRQGIIHHVYVSNIRDL